MVRFAVNAKEGRDQWDGMVLDAWSFCVTITLVLGNSLLLHHMHRRHTGLLRCSILLAWVEVFCLVGITLKEKIDTAECSHLKLNRDGDCTQTGITWYAALGPVVLPAFQR